MAARVHPCCVPPEPALPSICLCPTSYIIALVVRLCVRASVHNERCTCTLTRVYRMRQHLSAPRPRLTQCLSSPPPSFPSTSHLILGRLVAGCKQTVCTCIPCFHQIPIWPSQQHNMVKPASSQKPFRCKVEPIPLPRRQQVAGPD